MGPERPRRVLRLWLNVAYRRSVDPLAYPTAAASRPAMPVPPRTIHAQTQVPICGCPVATVTAVSPRSYRAGTRLAATAGAGAASAASISSIVRPLVSMPMNQNAAAPSTYQKAK